MDYFLFLFAFILVTKTAAVPRITDPKEEEIIIKSGEPFKIVCVSETRIEWKFPKNIGGSDVKVESTNDKHESTLMIQHVNYMDVGYYTCFGDEKNEDKVYLYVEDNEHPVALNNYLTQMIVESGESVVLPCKPTSPNINLHLFASGEEVIPDGQKIIQSKEGFLIQTITVSQKGYYFCCTSDIIDTSCHNIDVTVRESNLKLLPPKVFGSKHVRVGLNVTLTCNVSVPATVEAIKLKWKLPENSKLKRNQYQLTEDIHQSNENGKILTAYQHNLTIFSVIPDNTGVYVCEVFSGGNKNNDSIHLQIHNGSFLYINAGLEDIYAWEGNDTTLAVDWSADPNVKNIKWLDPHVQEINNSLKYTVKNSEYQTMLTIHNVNVKDGGKYTISLQTSERLYTSSATLFVFGKPHVDMSLKDNSYVMPNKTLVVYCVITDSRSFNVSFIFQECLDGKNCSSAYKEYCFQSKVHNTNETIRLISSCSFSNPETGHLSCVAENMFGKTSSTAGLLVSDIPDGFYLEKQGDFVTGAEAKLICGASKLNYTRDIAWYWMKGSRGKFVRLKNGTGVLIQLSETNYSYNRTIYFPKVTNSMGGLYWCTDSVDREDAYGRDSTFNVTVREPIMPYFTVDGINMFNDSKTIPVYGRYTLVCNPRGMPAPTVTWMEGDKILYEKSANQFNLTVQFKKENEALYTCIAQNRVGTIIRTQKVIFAGVSQNNKGLIAGIASAGIILAGLVAFLLFRLFKEKKQRTHLSFLENFFEGSPESMNPDLPVDEQADLLPYDQIWEFPRENLKLGRQLGSGAFGVVLKAKADGILEQGKFTTVAVKMVKRTADITYIKALISELKIMCHLGKHLNVVNLLGACTRNIKSCEILVIVEYCRFGNLHNYLQRNRKNFIDQIDHTSDVVDFSVGSEIISKLTHASSKSLMDCRAADLPAKESDASIRYRALPTESSTSGLSYNEEVSMNPNDSTSTTMNNSTIQPEWRSNYRSDYQGEVHPICTRDLLCWSYQVACGMEYLAKRKVLHGDLAARNVLLADDNIVKICDFGLAKSMYKSDNYKKKSDGPLPFKWLAIESIKDHIFSTQSDIWAYGVTIWEFFSLATTPYPGMEADEKLLTKLISGYRMEKPQYANQQVYQTMLSCWNVNPSCRPTFTELRCNFEELLEESVKNHYAYLNNVYITMNTKEFQNAGNDYLAMMSTPDYNNFSSLLFCRNSMNYVNSDALSENPGEGNDLGYVSMQKQQSDTLESATKDKETSSSGDRLRRKRSLHRSDQRQSIKKKLETAISFSNPTYNDLLSKSSAADGYVDM